MTAIEMIKLASQLSDYGRFSELGEQLREAMMSGNDAEFKRISGLQQDIKNRYQGHQPPGKMPDPNWRVSRQAPETFVHPTAGPQTMPGYTQIDDISGGQNRWSSNPVALARKGYKMPDLAKLPTGRFGLGEAAHNLWSNSYLGRGSISPAAFGYPQMEAALALAQKMGPSPQLPLMAERGGVSPLTAMKSWRRMTQRSNPEFNQAFRRFANPNALKFLINAAKNVR